MTAPTSRRTASAQSDRTIRVLLVTVLFVIGLALVGVMFALLGPASNSKEIEYRTVVSHSMKSGSAFDK